MKPVRFTGIISILFLACFSAADEPRFAGPTKDGAFLLPNGWTLTPAGRHTVLTDLPLNIIPLADKKHALVGTGGFNRHELSLIDLETGKVAATADVRQSWFGLAHRPQARKDMVVRRRPRHRSHLRPEGRQVHPNQRKGDGPHQAIDQEPCQGLR